MPALVSSKEIESVLRQRLSEAGYALSRAKNVGETGTDIIAKKEDENLHIETIAFKSSPPARSKDFYEVFFRAISRLPRGATLCVIALPDRFGDGLHQRASTIGTGWLRIGLSFPELEVWLVDTKNRTYKSTAWNSWLE
jgi:hypothetical protein